MKRSFSNRLIVSDLDGTFLGAKGEVLSRNVEAIRAFQKQGGRFTFATGRTYRTLCELVPGLSELVNAPLILLNGSLLYDPITDTTLQEFRLSLAEIFSLLESIMQRYPKLCIRILRGNEAYESRSLGALYSLRCMDDCHKIVLLGEPKDLSEIQSQLRMSHGHILHICKSCDVLLELLPKGASKGVLLDKMRELLFASEEVRVYGIGDFENDLELLAHADVAACPQNAIEAVKRASARILCHHTKGAIADLVETIYNET